MTIAVLNSDNVQKEQDARHLGTRSHLQSTYVKSCFLKYFQLAYFFRINVLSQT